MARSRIDFSTLLLTLCKSQVRPIGEYGSHIWSVALEPLLKREIRLDERNSLLKKHTIGVVNCLFFYTYLNITYCTYYYRCVNELSIRGEFNRLVELKMLIQVMFYWVKINFVIPTLIRVLTNFMRNLFQFSFNKSLNGIYWLF